VSLTVRAYNVLFGDCILLSWDEDDGRHHAWVDFGNLLDDPNLLFDTVYDDVLARTGGRLDLALVTHRHLDHLEGFYACRQRFARDFQVDRLWHAHVTPALDNVFRLADQAMTALLPRATVSGEGELGRLYRNNHELTTRDRMAEIVRSFPAASAHAIHRRLDLRAERALPPGMRRMRIQVLAPEEDSGRYLRPLEEGLASRQALQRSFDALPAGASRPAMQPRQPYPQDPGYLFLPELADFERLRRRLRTGGLETLAAVDKTRNNTSVVTRWTYDQTISLLLTGERRADELVDHGRQRRGLLRRPAEGRPPRQHQRLPHLVVRAGLPAGSWVQRRAAVHRLHQVHRRARGPQGFGGGRLEGAGDQDQPVPENRRARPGPWPLGGVPVRLLTSAGLD
jgi:hypothetical protein